MEAAAGADHMSLHLGEERRPLTGPSSCAAPRPPTGRIPQGAFGLAWKGFPDRLADVPNVIGRLSKLAEEERQDFSRLQEDVWDSIGEHEVLEASFDRQFDRQRTFGELSADNVAAWGGSWSFVIVYFAFIFGWIGLNMFIVGPWDPYPFILLNLVLSTMSAFQAPIIMMSQNRQTERDRLQSDYTARVNLRAELMTRHINAKLDALINSSWRRLLESQAIQTTLLERVIEMQKMAEATATTTTSNHNTSSHTDISNKPLKVSREETLMTPQLSLRSQCSMQSAPSPRHSSIAPSSYVHDRASIVSVYNQQPQQQQQVVVATSTTTSTGEHWSPGSMESSSQGKQHPPLEEHGEVDVFSTPLASLCLAPPSARLFPGVEIPWFLETERDDHLIFLLRSMLHAPVDLDDQLLIFEHRLANFGDNFCGRVGSNVRLEARDQASFSLAGVSLSVPMTPHMRGCAVSPTYVASVVDGACMVASGAGAEPWMPFDVTYDLEFTEGAVLDSIFAGEGFVSLRNVLDLPSMAAGGVIKRLVLHPRGCPCSLRLDRRRQRAMSFSSIPRVPSPAASGLPGGDDFCPMAIYLNNGELPPRFKPSVSSSREDRIADFWRAPLARIEISYSPAPIFACVTLRGGQAATPLAVDFHQHHSHTQANAATTVGAEKSQISPPKVGAAPPPPPPPPPPLPFQHLLEKSMSRRSFQTILDVSSSSIAQSNSGRDDGPLSALNPPSPVAASTPRSPRLFLIVNPSGESLCNALAFGITDTSVKADESSRVEVAERIDELTTPDTIPHNVWLEVPMVENSTCWRIDMPCELTGPAALFFYSPDGRVRMRGTLRDDGGQEDQVMVAAVEREEGAAHEDAEQEDEEEGRVKNVQEHEVKDISPTAMTA